MSITTNQPQENTVGQVIIPEIETATKGLAEADVASLQAAFSPFFEAFREAGEKAQEVGDDPKKARASRLELRRIRCDAEKARKSLKEDSLRRGKAIDGINNVLLYALKPIEEAMDKVEKAEERRIEAERVAKLEARRAAVSDLLADHSVYNLEDMTDDAFDVLLSDIKEANEAREAAERRAAEEAARKAEEERVAAEKAEAERVKREEEMAAENARLKAEVDAREAKAAEERRKREEAEAEAKRVRDEKEAEERAERERVAAEEAARAEETRKAAAAPDKAKVAALAADVRALSIPSLATSPGLVEQIARQVEKFAAWLESEAGKL